jgi:steroid delta-isomerase-like uncharacterized protein
MSGLKHNKRVVSSLIEEVWNQGDLSILSDFWSEDCINHAMPGADNRGLAALSAYHESLAATLQEAFIDFRTEILQQIAEDDRVVTHMKSSGKHQGVFLGIPATGRDITMLAMRIDRLHKGKIIEHWSIADMADLMQQLQA